MCLFRCQFRAKALPQWLHLNFFTPSWNVFLWSNKALEYLYSFPHKSHLNFFPKWTLCSCSVKSIFFPNFLLHTLHSNFFLQYLWCNANFCAVSNYLSHWSHSYFWNLWVMVKCFFKPNSVAKDLSQTLYLNSEIGSSFFKFLCICYKFDNHDFSSSS